MGIPVQLRARLVAANWDFGDGATDSTSDPGQPYLPHTYDTAQCPDYYGHTDTRTGDYTVTLTITWNGQYSLDGGATWIAIPPAPLTVAPASTPVQTRQTTAVLVSPPS